MANVQQITAWSFSRWAVYTSCPFKAKCKFIDKLPEPPAPAMERGSAIHKLAENFTNGTIRKLPPELKLFADDFKMLKKNKAEAEGSLAFTKNWDLTGWFDKDAWCRVKVDASFILPKKKHGVIIDHKTGKPKEDHIDQLSLYKLTMLLANPSIETVDAELWYLDHGTKAPKTPETSSREEIAKLKKEWEGKTKAMLADKKFSPKQNFGCQWCPFAKKKGGPCKF